MVDVRKYKGKENHWTAQYGAMVMISSLPEDLVKTSPETDA